MSVRKSEKGLASRMASRREVSVACGGVDGNGDDDGTEDVGGGRSRCEEGRWLTPG